MRKALILSLLLAIATTVAIAWYPAVFTARRSDDLAFGAGVRDGLLIRYSRASWWSMTERSWELTDLSRDTWDAESNRRDAREILELGPAKAQLNTEAFADQVRDMGIPLPHLPEYTRADHLAERGPPDPILPTDIPDSGLTCTRTDYGWPLPALGSTSKLWFEYSGDGPDGVPTSVEPISETHGVIELPWSFHAKRFKQLGMEPTTQIPIKPRPAGFTLNTAIFFAVWATLLVAPIALRRQIRRIRGQCKHCGYQTHSLPRCPECGSNA